MKTVESSKVTLSYVCNRCQEKARQPLSDVVYAGTLICPRCGEDMAIDEHCTVESEDPRVLITVEGGIVSSVVSTVPLDYWVKDFDSMKHGDFDEDTEPQVESAEVRRSFEDFDAACNADLDHGYRAPSRKQWRGEE